MNSLSCIRESRETDNVLQLKETKNSLNYMFYLQLKFSQSQNKEVIKCTFCCNSKGNEPVSLEQWGVMKLISVSLRGNLTDQKTLLKEN